MKSPFRWIMLLVIASLQGCQSYIKHDIAIRDADTGEPVQVGVEVGYDMRDELSRTFALFTPKLKRYTTETDEHGRAVIRIAADVRWFVVLKKGGTLESVSFHEDGSVSHTFGRVREQDGWLSTRVFGATSEKGTLEVRITRLGD